MNEENQETRLKTIGKRHTANELQDVNDVSVSQISSYKQHPYYALALGVFEARTIPCGFANQFRLSMERENSGFSDQ